MASDVTRDEFSRLEARVSVVEREVEGEKMVTRHVLEQTRRNSDDLASIKSRLDRVEEKLDGVDRKVDDLDRKMVGLSVEFRSFPTVVADVVRDAMSRRGKRQPRS
jgi:tetrahydromethanopterin S-methyltransferase subunit G